MSGMSQAAPRSTVAGDEPGDDPAPLAPLIGLDPGADAVYRSLLDAPASTAAGLAAGGPGGAADVAAVLDDLVARGLAVVERPRHDDAGPDGGRTAASPRYRAASPAVALGPVLDAQRAALREVENAVAALTDRHRAAQSRTGGGPVEVMVGARVIRHRLIALQHEARQQIRTIMPSRSPTTVISLEDNFEEAEREAMRRGVRIRTVMDRGWLDDPRHRDALTGFVEAGQQLSVADGLSIKLVIADDDVAVLPLDPAHHEADEPVSLVVHRSGLLTALITLFEQSFEGGWLLGTGGAAPDAGARPGSPRPTVPDAVDRQILTLLRVGMTDAAIARYVGMGHRTVQRRLHDLMTSVGAATRFQLGWHAAVAGWLDDDPS
ncbi:hypothetical protein ISCU110981_05895 [Isoptericola cucumis]